MAENAGIYEYTNVTLTFIRKVALLLPNSVLYTSG